MKGILGLLRHKTPPEPAEERLDSMLFTTAFTDREASASPLVPWEARAAEIGASRLSPSQGTKLLQGLWARDKFMCQLDQDAIARMERFFDFATVAAKRELIRQDELGNFMLVLLRGRIAIDRLQPWGEHLRLAEAGPGEILGEMSLLDSGIRLSVCSTLSDCNIAVLSADALDQMLGADPALAANLIALLARKLSLRMRVISARLNDKK